MYIHNADPEHVVRIGERKGNLPTVRAERWMRMSRMDPTARQLAQKFGASRLYIDEHDLGYAWLLRIRDRVSAVGTNANMPIFVVSIDEFMPLPMLIHE